MDSPVRWRGKKRLSISPKPSSGNWIDNYCTYLYIIACTYREDTHIVPDPVKFGNNPGQSEMRHVWMLMQDLCAENQGSCHADCGLTWELWTTHPAWKTNTHPSPNETETTTLGLLWQQLIRVHRPQGQWVIMGCLKWEERFHHLAIRYSCSFFFPGGSSDLKKVYF